MKPTKVLETTAGPITLAECRVGIGGREWTIAYSSAVVSHAEESRYLAEKSDWMPYGMALWPAALALAHEIAVRSVEFRGNRVLELGAGTGLPGIVAAALGAKVVQSDRQELALHMCKQNGEANRVKGIEYHLADWREWQDNTKYDWIIGADILYADTLHEHLRKIFETNLVPGGRVLIGDPFRAESLRLLEPLSVAGWAVTHSRWAIGEGEDARPVAVYELVPNRSL
jgi:predicted nicotinamide N-methyase